MLFGRQHSKQSASRPLTLPAKDSKQVSHSIAEAGHPHRPGR
jgi:hypothetical protein